MKNGWIFRGVGYAISLFCAVWVTDASAQSDTNYWYGTTNRSPNWSGSCFYDPHANWSNPNQLVSVAGPSFPVLEFCATGHLIANLGDCERGPTDGPFQVWSGGPDGDKSPASAQNCCRQGTAWKYVVDSVHFQEGQIGVQLNWNIGHRTTRTCPEEHLGKQGFSAFTVFNHNCIAGQELTQWFPGSVPTGTPICRGACIHNVSGQDQAGNVTMVTTGEVCAPDERPGGGSCDDWVNNEFDAQCWCDNNPDKCREEGASVDKCEIRPDTNLEYFECPIGLVAELPSISDNLVCSDSDWGNSGSGNKPKPSDVGAEELCYDGCLYQAVGESENTGREFVGPAGGPYDTFVATWTYFANQKDAAGNVIWTGGECTADDGSGRDPDTEGMDGDTTGDGDGACDPAVEDCSGLGDGDGDGGTGSGSGSAGTGVASGNCRQRPSCGKASSIECAILRQQWNTMCSGWDDDLDDLAGDTVDADPEIEGEEFFVELDEDELGIDDSGWLGGGSCPELGTFEINGHVYEFDGDALCQILTYIGSLMVVGALAFGVIIIARA